MTDDEAQKIVQEEIDKALSGFIGQSVSQVTAATIKAAVIQNIHGLVNSGIFEPRKFDVRVTLNGNQVDVAIVDPDTGEILDLKDFLYQNHLEDFQYCSDCGWSGTEFHACEGSPDENSS